MKSMLLMKLELEIDEYQNENHSIAAAWYSQKVKELSVLIDEQMAIKTKQRLHRVMAKASSKCCFALELIESSDFNGDGFIGDVKLGLIAGGKK